MTTLQADRLLMLSKKARAAQKAYFKNRTQENLIASKVAESELDKHIVECETVATVTPPAGEFEFASHL